MWDVGTCRAAFIFATPLPDLVAALQPHDLVVGGEVSLLEKKHFEDITRMWEAAGRIPALVLLADKQQLPGSVRNTRGTTTHGILDAH